MPDARAITTWKQLLAMFPSTERIAGALRVEYATVVVWQRLGRVPKEHWGALVLAARDVGITGASVSLFSSLPSAKGVADITELLALWPSVTVLAGDLGLAHSTVRSWGIRNNVPVDRWDALLRSARSHGIKHVSNERLQAIAVARRASRAPASCAAGRKIGTQRPVPQDGTSRILRDSARAETKPGREKSHGGCLRG